MEGNCLLGSLIINVGLKVVPGAKETLLLGKNLPLLGGISEKLLTRLPATQ